MMESLRRYPCRLFSRTPFSIALPFLLLAIGHASGGKRTASELPIAVDIPEFRPEHLAKVEITDLRARHTKQAGQPELPEPVYHELRVTFEAPGTRQLEQQANPGKPQRSLATAATCADQYSGCADWVSKGYCEGGYTSDGKAISTYWCPKSCGLCGCADTTSQCPTWKGQGYCTPASIVTYTDGTKVSLMYDACPTTCGTCCLDKTTSCQSWGKTYCTGYTWGTAAKDIGKYWCPKTCGNCRLAPSTTPPPAFGCVDRDASCSSWKTSGYCDERFQLSGLSVKDYWCPKACGTCCQDVASSCATYKTQGYCDGGATAQGSDGVAKSIRDYWCRNTCQVCCMDKYPSCDQWKTGGYCAPSFQWTNQSVVGYWCPLTCGTCKSRFAPPAPPPRPPPSPPSPPLNAACSDHYDLLTCNPWRQQGYCAPKWAVEGKSVRNYWCAKSCSACVDNYMCNFGKRSLIQEEATPLEGDDRVPDADTLLATGVAPPLVKVHPPAPLIGSSEEDGSRRRQLLAAPDDNKPLQWKGGPIMTGTTRVHLVWYGQWASTTPTKPLIEDFVSNLGCSKWWNIMFGNCINGQSKCIGGLTLGRSIFWSSLVGAVSGDDDHGTKQTWNIVQAAVNSGQLGTIDKDHDLVMIMASKEVKLASTFGSKWCGWHSSWPRPATSGQAPIKFGILGSPESTQLAGPSSCTSANPPPNGDFTADGFASILAHEIVETVTDPEGSAWYDGDGNENGDKCAWRFGNIQFLANRAPWNVKVGSRNWFIQMNWNVDTNRCEVEANF